MDGSISNSYSSLDRAYCWILNICCIRHDLAAVPILLESSSNFKGGGSKDVVKRSTSIYPNNSGSFKKKILKGKGLGVSINVPKESTMRGRQI